MRHKIIGFCLYVEIFTLFLDLSLCFTFNENKVASSGSKNLEGKIVGGKPVDIDQVPSAVLFFNHGAMCGGTILNSWSVVTAAHCVDHNKNPADMSVHTRGKPVDIDQVPSAVLFFNYGAMCGGTILNSWSVIKAAHCVDHNNTPDDMSVHTHSRYAFDKNAKIYKVSYVVAHKDYNITVPFACDVAVLFVSKPMQFGLKAQKALIANDGRWMNAKVKDFHVTGWGMTTYGGPTSKFGLLMTHLTFVPLDECSSLHKIKLTPDMFCLYGDAARDTCKGDSGSGVHWNRYLVGIVSHGDGCGKKNKPSIYTNVWYFRSWLEETIQNHFREYCTTKRSIRKRSKKSRFKNRK